MQLFSTVGQNMESRVRNSFAPLRKNGFHCKYFLAGRNTDNIPIGISVPNFANCSLQINYAFHCKDFYQTQNISMVLHEELLYKFHTNRSSEVGGVGRIYV